MNAQNLHTTGSGVVAGIMAVLSIVLKMYYGHPVDASDLAIITGVLSGAYGLIKARDARTPETVVEKTTTNTQEIKSQ